MNYVRTLGFMSLSLFSLNACAQETYTYRQEFEAFRQSNEFTELLEIFVDTLASASTENVGATQRSTLLSSLIEMDFIFSCPDSLPLLDTSLDRLCTLCQREKPLVIIIDRTLPWGDEIARQFESEGAALIITKDFLLGATDEQLEIFIVGKLEELQQLAQQASGDAANQASGAKQP
jgi:hypothetical protein